MNQYAIVVDNINNLRFINLETYTIDYSLKIDYDIMDVVVTNDHKKAYVTAFNPPYLLEIDLSSNKPYLKKAIPLNNYAEEVALTPDDSYAIIANGGSFTNGTIGINLDSNTINRLEMNTQAVIAPTNTKVFIASYLENKIKRLSISKDGILSKTHEESLNSHPINLCATSDSNFIFSISFSEKQIEVLDISHDQHLKMVAKISTKNKPQSLVINKSNDILYVLEENIIEIFSFNVNTHTFSLINTIVHGMPITPFYGVDQIALSSDEQLLIFLTSEVVNIYSIQGEFVAQTLITPYGGIATYQGEKIYHNQYDVLVTSGSELIMIDSQKLEEIGRVDLAAELGSKVILDSIAVSSDYKKAVVTTFDGNKIIELDITKNMPKVTHTIDAPTRTFSAAITPDNRFVVIGGSSGSEDHRLYTYNLETKQLKEINLLWHDLSINPKSGDVYIGQFILNRVKKYLITSDGNLIFSNQESTVDDWPTFLTFHPKGNYLFVNYGQTKSFNGIDVLDTSNSEYFGITNKIYGIDGAYTTLINRAGDTVYLLTNHTVSQYAFDTFSEGLSFVKSFNHTLKLSQSFGTPKMIFNENETELLILSGYSLVKYSIQGEKIGELDLHLPRGLVRIS